MRSSYILIFVGLACVAALASCQPRPTPRTIGGHYEKFTTRDGLDCISWKEEQAGGLSCNWEAFNRKNPQ